MRESRNVCVRVRQKGGWSVVIGRDSGKRRAIVGAVPLGLRKAARCERLASHRHPHGNGGHRRRRRAAHRHREHPRRSGRHKFWSGRCLSARKRANGWSRVFGRRRDHAPEARRGILMGQGGTIIPSTPSSHSLSRSRSRGAGGLYGLLDAVNGAGGTIGVRSSTLGCTLRAST